MKKNLLLLAAAMAAVTLTAQAEEVWTPETDFIIDGQYNNNGLANAVHFTYNGDDGVFECNMTRLWGTFKIHPVTSTTDDSGKLTYKAVWRPQYGSSTTEVGNVYIGQTCNLSMKMVDSDATPGNLKIAASDSHNFAVIHNAHLVFNPGAMTLTITGETSDDLWIVGDLPTGYKTEPDGANKLSFVDGKYTGVIDFGDKSNKAVKLASKSYSPNFAYTGGDNVTPISADDESTWRHNLKIHYVDAGKTTINDKSITYKVTNKAARANITGKWNVEFDPATQVFAVSKYDDPGSATVVEEIGVEAEAPVEYFNMQGIRVENPENGMFIRRQGNKATKVRVK